MAARAMLLRRRRRRRWPSKRVDANPEHDRREDDLGPNGTVTVKVVPCPTCSRPKYCRHAGGQVRAQEQARYRCPHACDRADPRRDGTVQTARQIRFGNSDAGIAHDEHGVGSFGVDCNLDPAVQREFECVGNQVENDLLPHVAVDVDRLCGQGQRPPKPGLLVRMPNGSLMRVCC